MTYNCMCLYMLRWMLLNHSCCTVCLLVSFRVEQLRYKRAAEVLPRVHYEQVRRAALVLTVGVDTAATVDNLDTVTRAGVELYSP